MIPDPAKSQKRPSSPLIALILAALVVAVLADQIGGIYVMRIIASFSFFCLCVVGVRYFSIREGALLGLSIGLATYVLTLPEGRNILLASLSRASFFAAFIAALTVLKEAADRSDSVLQVGRYLTSRPPGQRFYVTAGGGHILGVFLNFGAISLLAPLIQKSAAGPDKQLAKNMERRQLSALLRGFSWILLWAPTTLTQAVLLTLFPGVDLARVIILGLLTTVIMIWVGRLYDRFEWRGQTLPQNTPVTGFPKPAASAVAGICALLIGITYSLCALLDISVAQSLMLVAPSVTLAWFIAQGETGKDIAALKRHLATIPPIMAGAAVPLSRSAVALGLSGFIGQIAAEVAPVDLISDYIDLLNVPGWIFLAALPVLIVLGGQVALSPIMVVVFLSEVISALPSLPLDPVYIVYALSAGWALSMTASPNATATLLISATSNIPPTILTWRWNARYSLICYLILVVIFRILAPV